MVNFHHLRLLALQASTKRGLHSYQILGSEYTASFVILKRLEKSAHTTVVASFPEIMTQKTPQTFRSAMSKGIQWDEETIAGATTTIY